VRVRIEAGAEDKSARRLLLLRSAFRLPTTTTRDTGTAATFHPPPGLDKRDAGSDFDCLHRRW
jgi:hypothetical protein